MGSLKETEDDDSHADDIAAVRHNKVPIATEADLCIFPKLPKLPPITRTTTDPLDGLIAAFAVGEVALPNKSKGLMSRAELETFFWPRNFARENTIELDCNILEYADGILHTVVESDIHADTAQPLRSIRIFWLSARTANDAALTVTD